ncbi:ABC transporter substrate-binding protein [Actibacterium pelagium]|uniref:Iron(III) transport system substrate-binding protein n=1 Tax=Actibacterium pelagium TaxID=2029103 RepID=A0A917AMX2_9RHOB|nr:extracellular solute-binding protein [Actibacterium pelagium]GGE59108.1 hypothetical protein GCM10011517_28520 [Actibacterium pelagium]
MFSCIQIVKKFAAGLAIACLPSFALASDWPVNSSPEFEALLEAAKEEGRVIVMGNPNLGDDIAAAFEEDTGLKFQLIPAGRREGPARFQQETAADNASFDIYLHGPANADLRDAGKYLSLGDHLFLPEVTEGSNWRGGALAYVDNTRLYNPVPSRYVAGRILVDSRQVDPSSITNWTDLLRDDLRGKIIAHDPNFPGAGQTLATFLTAKLGAKFVKDLYVGQDVALTGDMRQTTDTIARGEYAVALAPIARHIVKYQAEGFDFIKVISLQDHPGYLVGGASAMTAPSSAPHPYAARVFANWFLSQRAQTIYSNLMSVPSDRVDVVEGAWPKFVEPVEGEDYLDTYAQDWWENDRKVFAAELRKALSE